MPRSRSISCTWRFACTQINPLFLLTRLNYAVASLNQGTKEGLDAFYNIINSYGLHYASLAQDVVDDNYPAGSTAVNFMKTQAASQGVQIDASTQLMIELKMAQGYANVLQANITAGMPNNDITFQQALDLHTRVFGYFGLAPTTWTLYAPYEVLGLSKMNQEFASITNSDDTLHKAQTSAELYADVAAHASGNNIALNWLVDTASAASGMTLDVSDFQAKNVPSYDLPWINQLVQIGNEYGQGGGYHVFSDGQGGLCVLNSQGVAADITSAGNFTVDAGVGGVRVEQNFNSSGAETSAMVTNISNNILALTPAQLNSLVHGGNVGGLTQWAANGGATPSGDIALPAGLTLQEMSNADMSKIGASFVPGQAFEFVDPSTGSVVGVDIQNTGSAALTLNSTQLGNILGLEGNSAALASNASLTVGAGDFMENFFAPVAQANGSAGSFDISVFGGSAASSLNNVNNVFSVLGSNSDVSISGNNENVFAGGAGVIASVTGASNTIEAGTGDLVMVNGTAGTGPVGLTGGDDTIYASGCQFGGTVANGWGTGVLLGANVQANVIGQGVDIWAPSSGDNIGLNSGATSGGDIKLVGLQANDQVSVGGGSGASNADVLFGSGDGFGGTTGAGTGTGVLVAANLMLTENGNGNGMWAPSGGDQLSMFGSGDVASIARGSQMLFNNNDNTNPDTLNGSGLQSGNGQNAGVVFAGGAGGIVNGDNDSYATQGGGAIAFNGTQEVNAALYGSGGLINGTQDGDYNVANVSLQSQSSTQNDYALSYNSNYDVYNSNTNSIQVMGGGNTDLYNSFSNTLNDPSSNYSTPLFG